jgi:hypothetical protein
MGTEGPPLANFDIGWIEEGTGSDGLPLYRETVLVTISRPPELTLPAREPTQEDLVNFAEEYRAFQLQQAGREAMKGESGYPLVMWPAVNAAEVKMLAVRGIYTVQQLAAVTSIDAPPQIRELAARAKKMITLMQETGAYEAKINELTSANKELMDQITEMKAIISAQMAQINNMRGKAA